MKAVGILSIFLGFMTLQVLAAPVNDLPAVGDLSAVEDHYGYDDNIHVTEPDVLTSSEEEEKNPDERTPLERYEEFSRVTGLLYSD